MTDEQISYASGALTALASQNEMEVFDREWGSLSPSDQLRVARHMATTLARELLITAP